MKNICVYCGSSTQVAPAFFKCASILGKLIAQKELTLVYGGGSLGLMGEIARSALEEGGKVTGIIPRFMYEENWFYDGLSELIIVETMHERKLQMAEMADAFIALPGGCGTLEELFEIITWKQLGLITEPIIIVNVDGYYNSLIEMLNQCVQKQFMREKHLKLWTTVDHAEEVFMSIDNSPKWDVGYRKFAAI